jgi:hypothetical protein
MAPDNAQAGGACPCYSLKRWTVPPEVEDMREHYDFSRAKRNPYAANLINLYLRDCALNRKKLSLRWKPAA